VSLLVSRKSTLLPKKNFYFNRLPYIEEIIKYFGPKGITIRQLELPYKNGNYRDVFQSVKLYHELNILLCCSIDILPDVFKQAQQVGIMTDHHQYIVTTMDMHTIDLEPYQYGGTNITGESHHRTSEF
jgi:ionotropic glutamate receptor